MTLQGKGFFTWILSNCEGGDPASIVAAAQAAGLSHVFVKIADGVKAFGVDASGFDFTAPVVQALRAAGIAVWGWHYVYGNDPSAEANIAIQCAQSLGLDGYVVNAEDEYKQPGKDAAARQFMSAVRGALTVPIALSSYRFPNYHAALPWSVFLERCDYHMPQVYWEQAHNAAGQLRESKRQCDALPNAKPYIATGPTYGVTGWEPTPTEISEFLSTTRALGIPAVNFFDWHYCRKYLPEIWTTIAEFDWVVPTQVTSAVATTTTSSEASSQPSTETTTSSETTSSAEATSPETTSSAETTSSEATSSSATTSSETTPSAPSDVFSTQFLAALNSRKAGQVAALYRTTAVRVWADDIMHGPISVQAAYATFFSGLPDGTTFTLSTVKVDDDLRFLIWKAGSLTGQTTLVLQSGKIILDYTFLA
jgi:hypothetical protein